MGVIQEIGCQVSCRWCGMTTLVGSTCAECGSPMEVLVRCRYCRRPVLDAVCGGCQDVLIRLWTIAQGAPEARFLFADVL
jgi:hypothetical protein